MKEVYGYVAVILAFLLVVSFVLFFSFGSVDSDGKPAETVSFYRLFSTFTKTPEVMSSMASQLRIIMDINTDHFAVSSPDRVTFDERGNPVVEWGSTYTYDFTPFDSNESDNWFYRVAVGFFDAVLGALFRLICINLVIVNNVLGVPFLYLQGLMYGGYVVTFDAIRMGPFGGVA